MIPGRSCRLACYWSPEARWSEPWASGVRKRAQRKAQGSKGRCNVERLKQYTHLHQWVPARYNRYRNEEGITEAGGQVLFVQNYHAPHYPLTMHRQSVSNATHIVSSQPLNGTKTQNLLKSSSRTKRYVVKPEWVVDSISAGRRLQEERYKLTRGVA